MLSNEEFLDAVAAGQAVVPIHRVYRLDQIGEAHAEMEAGRAAGKLVVVLENDEGGRSRDQFT